MYEENSATEQESSAEGSNTTSTVPTEGKQATINKLFDKMSKLRLEDAGVGNADARAANNSRSQLEASVINRLFSSYTQLEAIEPPPELKKPIIRITHTEIKAMKAVSTTAEIGVN